MSMPSRIPWDLLSRDLTKIGVIAVAFAILPLFAVRRFHMRVFTILIAFILFGIALNIIFGHTDQLFLFVGGLGAVGGYTMVLLADTVGVTPWLTLPVGILFAGVVGAAISYVAAKRNMTLILIAIFTLALQLALMEFIVGAGDLTGSSVGMPVEDVIIDSDRTFYYVFFAMLVLYLVIYSRLMDSRYGYAFMAIRQDEVAASSIGVDTVHAKVVAAAVGSMMIGAVGGVYALWSGWISPDPYQFLRADVFILIIITLGGLRTLTGPVVGGVVVIGLREFVLDDYPQWHLVIFGVLLIGLYLYFRSGIVPTVTEFVKAHRHRLPVLGDGST